MSIDPRFDSGFARTRNAQNEVLNRGKRNHMGTLDFAAYANANSKRFLGFQGSLFLGRSYGNDSSNVTSCMDIPGYWKINYYKGEALVSMLLFWDVFLCELDFVGQSKKNHAIHSRAVLVCEALRCKNCGAELPPKKKNKS